MSNESAVARVEHALDQAHATQDTVNAFISLDDERALRRAAEIDRRLAEGEDVGILAGVPVGLKDLIEHEGRVTTCGSSFYAETATTSATCVQRLEDAGAIVIGRTNLHEWAFGFNSENEFWGPVRNPWDLDTSAGGSSGGSGAAVAAGITPIAIGTDTGGSVRVPAALCGTFGLKVTYGKIPLDGVFPLVPSIDTVGPLANSMAGIESSYRAMSGDDSPTPAATGLRIGIPEPWFWGAPFGDGVDTSFESTVSALKGLGHEVRPIDMPGTHPSTHIMGALKEVTEVHKVFRDEGREYSAAVEDRIIAVEATTPEQVARSREWQQMLRRRFTDAFTTVDFLITPSSPVKRKLIGVDTIGDKEHRAVLSYFSAIVNHALHPAISVPIAGSGEPPMSLQVIGPLDSETHLIGFGYSLEAAGLAVFQAPTSNSPNEQGR